MTPATVMQPEVLESRPVHFGFLTLPNFSMIAFTSAERTATVEISGVG